MVVAVRKEAVMIAGAVVALLALVGVVVTPEQHEAIEAIIVIVLPIVMGLIARQQVASKETVRKELGSNSEARLFPNKR